MSIISIINKTRLESQIFLAYVPYFIVCYFFNSMGQNYTNEQKHFGDLKTFSENRFLILLLFVIFCIIPPIFIYFNSLKSKQNKSWLLKTSVLFPLIVLISFLLSIKGLGAMPITGFDMVPILFFFAIVLFIATLITLTYLIYTELSYYLKLFLRKAS